MTKLTETRLLADRGVLAVSRVLNLAGATAEVIVNDLGEDLLVQTQNRSVADSFHVLVQVKSTRLVARKGGGFGIRVDVDHLYRWSTHMQPVVLCVYDDETHRTYAIQVNHYYSLWQLSTTNRKTLLVSFDDTNLFDKRNATKLIWRCRIGHFESMLRWYERAMDEVMQFGMRKAIARQYAGDRNLVAFRFLQALGAVLDDRVATRLRRYLRNASSNFAKENAKKSGEPLTFVNACGLGLLLFTSEVTSGEGLPSSLIEHGARVLAGAVEQFHPKEFAKASRLFPNQHV
jgi:Domain of unknown function (DUF4365)